MKSDFFNICLAISCSSLAIILFLDSHLSYDKEYLRPLSYIVIISYIFFLIVTKIFEKRSKQG